MCELLEYQRSVDRARKVAAKRALEEEDRLRREIEQARRREQLANNDDDDDDVEGEDRAAARSIATKDTNETGSRQR